MSLGLCSGHTAYALQGGEEEEDDEEDDEEAEKDRINERENRASLCMRY